MSTFPSSPASRLGRRSRDRASSRPQDRPYPAVGTDPRDVALEATRALVVAVDGETVRQIVATAVRDLGGALVPARFEPEDAFGIDVSFGLGEPVVVVVEPLSVAALGLKQVVPALVDDARSALLRQTAFERRRTHATVPGVAATTQARARYLRAVDRADVTAASALVTALLHDGASPASIVDEVLAPAQREAGERWYRREWTSADEHTATAITDRCLAALPPDTTGPRIVVAAPEGEWHALPTRMAAVAACGTRATALGAGLPARDLRRHLESSRPAALALSCTMSTNLLAAAASIAAAHAAGVPVVAGGRAFGRNGHRAQALGADAWSSTPGGLAALVPTLSPGSSCVVVPHEALLADAVPDDLLATALERQAAGSTWVGQMDGGQRRHALADLRWLTRHAAAALACDDPTVLDDLLGWLTPLLRDRGVPAHVLPDGARYLADALEPETPRVADLLRRGVEELT